MLCVKMHDKYKNEYKNEYNTLRKQGVSDREKLKVLNKMGYYETAILRFITNWSEYKQIYSFNSELKTEIFASMETIKDIPSDAIKRLPFSSFYVDASFNGYEGFFVKYAENRLEVMLVSNYFGNNNVLPFILNLEKTLDDAVKETVEEFNDIMKSFNKSRMINKFMENGSIDVSEVISLYKDRLSSTITRKEIMEYYRKVVSLILYICSENADIKTPVTAAVNNTKKPVRDRNKKNNIDIEPTVNKVGDEAVIVIRDAKKQITRYSAGSSATGTGKKRAAHVRKAHWHHYWMGSGDNKKLVVKWIPPVFIHPEKNDTKNIVINKL